jgi:hypothetical protein
MSRPSVGAVCRPFRAAIWPNVREPSGSVSLRGGREPAPGPAGVEHGREPDRQRVRRGRHPAVRRRGHEQPRLVRKPGIPVKKGLPQCAGEPAGGHDRAVLVPAVERGVERSGHGHAARRAAPIQPIQGKLVNRRAGADCRR